MICIARHIKAYHRQCFDREIADFGEPCSDCEFYKTCKFDWFARMKPLFENTNITIQLGRQGHFETLEKRVADLEKQVQSQPFGKGFSLAEQAFLLATLNVKLSNVNPLRDERSG